MRIADYKQWKSLLFIIPNFNDQDNKRFDLFREQILKHNPKVVMNAVRWNPDKKAAKAKDYVRAANEWNPTDFNWLGKHSNQGIQDYFNRPYDAMIVFSKDLFPKAMKIVQQSRSNLRIAFEEDYSDFDVILKAEENNLAKQFELIERYFFKG